jgi:hypothetical protein
LVNWVLKLNFAEWYQVEIVSFDIQKSNWIEWHLLFSDGNPVLFIQTIFNNQFIGPIVITSSIHSMKFTFKQSWNRTCTSCTQFTKATSKYQIRDYFFYSKRKWKIVCFGLYLKGQIINYSYFLVWLQVQLCLARIWASWAKHVVEKVTFRKRSK